MASKSKKSENEEFVKGKIALYKLSFDFDKKRHEMKMKELEFMRENDRIHHERELERGRIKSAEIRKAQMRKEQSAYKY